MGLKKITIKFDETLQVELEEYFRAKGITMIGEYKQAYTTKGRPKEVDVNDLLNVYMSYIEGEISEKECIRISGYAQSTFYNKLKELGLYSKKTYKLECTTSGVESAKQKAYIRLELARQNIEEREVTTITNELNGELELELEDDVLSIESVEEFNSIQSTQELPRSEESDDTLMNKPFYEFTNWT